MPRSLRSKFAGALYHLPVRGNAGAGIFSDAMDRRQFLQVLGKEIAQPRLSPIG